MKNRLVLLCVLVLNNLAFGCGNEYGFSLDGERIHTRYFFLSERMLHFNTVFFNKNLETLNVKVKDGTDDFKTWSNIALNLMKLGQADSSIQILRPLVKKHSNEYNLIANLGTAFELTGQLDSALFYISKGYKMNPNSHLKSEWIHIAILEAKIKERDERGWLKTNFVLNLDKLVKRVGTDIRGRRTNLINREIFLQIRTRAPFTPTPNKILANILETLGDFNMEVGTYENALLAYAYAMDFEPEESTHNQITKKIKILNNKRINNENIKELPITFQRMLKRSQIAPQLLVLGLVDFAENEDEFHLKLLQKNDSIELLVDEMDSIRLNTNLQIESLEKDQANEIKSIEVENKITGYLYLGVGVLIGALLMFIVGKRKQKKAYQK